ncbi:MAG: zinc ABC transporter substrate-binding protein [Dehalococcoidia bacterium]|nr:zinc ABC transporter substrate-binding protein [Dehalococcoidia bacterium]
MRGKITASIIAVLLLAALLLTMSCTSSPAASADIVAGSSLIADITQDLTDGKMEARNLIPPGICPGHYDVKPSDVETLANSKVFIIHNWQQNMKNITELVEAADNPGLVIKVIDVPDMPMVPQVQAETTDKIAQALGEIDPENSAYYQGRATERAQAVLAKGEEVKDKLQDANVSGVKVLCVEYQAGFVEWAGFDVVATYGRPEDLSVADVEDLVVQAKGAGVALAIDNLQSGATATSEAMAKDIGAIQVTISNFPGGFEDTETWEKAIDKNVDLLFEALTQFREQYG